MSSEAAGLCGACYLERSPERVNIRNGYRERDWDTRTGTIELAIPKLRHGSAAHYSDRISDHIFAEEQKRIRREHAAADRLLRRFEINHQDILDTVDIAIELTDNIQDAYLKADP